MSTVSYALRLPAIVGFKAAVLAGIVLGPFGRAYSETESARQIPLACSVDVVVVGGSTHAVAAASVAARSGSKVFLVAPRPYLGEDLCATLRLSLPPGREPQTELGRRTFRQAGDAVLSEGTSFKYTTDIASAAGHPDTRPPSLLTDGRADSASADSVQFDSDVRIAANLGGVQKIRCVRLAAFEKPADYGVQTIEVWADGKRLDDETGLKRKRFDNTGHPWSRLQLEVPVNGQVEQIEVFITRPEGCRRLLLGELIIETEPSDDLKQPSQSREKTAKAVRHTTTPQRVKLALDRELLDAGVPFLLGGYATDVLVDESGCLAGIVMANRAGRQAVAAKVVIDATDRAVVARMAGAKAYPWPGGKLPFERVVLTNSPGGKTRAIHHLLKLHMPDEGVRSFMRAEQEARDTTYQDGQLRASACLFQVPPDAIVCRKTADERKTTNRLSDKPIDLDHFRPRGIDRLHVLSGCADVPRDEATRLLDPLGLVVIGERIGARAAQQAAGLAAPRGVCVMATPETESGRGEPVIGEDKALEPETEASLSGGDVREVLRGMRPTDRGLKTVPSPAHELPVFGRYDVVVIGGGTAGAAAGIGAARRGARTLVVEYLEGLGGVGTLGLIGKAYHGRDVGFAAEVPFPDKNHNIEHKMEWYRRQLRQDGAEIWLGALGCGAWVEEQRVEGAVVATPHGRGLVLAHTTIDATGNADVAVAAGADYLFGANARHIALQGTGLPIRPLDRYYVNSDYLLVDESDMLDVWRALVGARAAMQETVFDSGTLIQTRERRRVVGDHVLRYLDQVAGRTYPDSIVLSASDYDSHGYPSQAYFALLPHDEKSRKANHPAPGGSCYTPYRCLLPKGLEGILVAGVGMSMERDASAMVRMQLDISNQGYAAGVAAAMAAEDGCAIRQIDVRKLQRHLVDTGALPEDVLTHDDSFPLASSEIQQAVWSLAEASNPAEAARPLAIVLSHTGPALPMLREAYRSAAGEAKLMYAKTLGMLGDSTGTPVLVEALDRAQWDGKILQGWAAEYAHLPTPVDAIVLALGNTKSEAALAPILRKLETLDAETTLSHHRAVVIALETLGDPAAAKPLARLLEKPGMRGHVMKALEPQHNAQREKRRRTGPLREIVIARALYRCGDCRGLGERILREYLGDYRGLFARHAQAILDEGPQVHRTNPKQDGTDRRSPAETTGSR